MEIIEVIVWYTYIISSENPSSPPIFANILLQYIFSDSIDPLQTENTYIWRLLGQAVPQKERSKAQKIDVRPAASVGEIFAVDSFNSEMSVKICLIWGI